MGPSRSSSDFVRRRIDPCRSQAPDAAERCTPDVMRLCSEFVPDADRIVKCIKVKRRQLSPSCATALQPGWQKWKQERRKKAKKKSAGPQRRVRRAFSPVLPC